MTKEDWKNEGVALVRYAIEAYTHYPIICDAGVDEFEAICGVSISPEFKAALRKEEGYNSE